jgi:hypothetical protein
MKNLLLTVICFIGINAYAQDSKLILGTWEYTDVYQKELLNEESLKMAKAFLTGMSLAFTETTATLTMMGKAEEVKWNFSKSNPRIIEATSKTGKPVKIEIISLDNKQLIMKMGAMGAMILNRKV